MKHATATKNMMRRLAAAIVALLPMATTYAQDVATCTNETFRKLACNLVSKGNIKYERSCRAGIKLYADSLEMFLKKRSEAGRLTAEGSLEDSLEFHADLLKLRGDWHYENGNYDSQSYAKAEAFFTKALAIYQTHTSLIGPLNRLPMIQRELAQLMYKTGRYQEALNYTTEACTAFLEAFDNGLFEEADTSLYSTMLNLKSQKAMCLARCGHTQEALLLMDSLLEDYPHGAEGYHEVLRKKGKIMMLSGQADATTQALGLYREFFAWKQADALRVLGTMTADERQDYWMRIRPFVADCYQLEQADPSFLYDVTLFAKGLLLQINRLSGEGKASKQALASLTYNWQQIQVRLTDGDFAIEFVQYEKGGEQKLGAIVLGKLGSPRWIQMMSPDDFMQYEIGPRTNKERIYTTEGKLKNSLYSDATLQATLWNEALQEVLQGAKRVYFAPDGYLHQIAIEYMLPQSIAQAEAFRLTSTRRLMESRTLKTDAALFVGGVDYNAKSLTSGTGNDAIAYNYVREHPTPFQYLKGSLTEVDTIYTIRSCPRDTILTGTQATELALRTLINQFPLLCISTHGEFGAAKVPQSTDVKTCLTDESLSQCIIAMAGINPNMAAEDFNVSQMDGMLSAREMAESNMENVELAIISACQTGMGYVTADGVYGIQRGLKNAGVKSLMVSLWSVDDKRTCILMTQLHKRLHDGIPVHRALMEARQHLASDEDNNEPQFCNAFILIDALE